MKIFAWFAAAFGTLAAITLLGGCSLATPSGHKIRVAVPAPPSVTAAGSMRAATSLGVGGRFGMSGLSASSQVADPIDASGFKCFGIQVIADDIADDPRVCFGSGWKDRIGQLYGMAPIGPVEGGFLEVEVLSGPARRVRVFGMASDPALGDFCPPGEDILNGVWPRDADNRPYGLGKAILLGESVVDVFEDMDVEVVADYDPLHIVEAFSCDDQGMGSGPVAGGIHPFAGSRWTINDAAGPNGTAFSFVPNSGSVMHVSDFTSAELGSLNTGDFSVMSNQPVPASANAHIVNSANPTGIRAQIRYEFDMTGFDLVATPYLKVEASFSAGALGSGTNCGPSTSQGYHGMVGIVSGSEATPIWVKGSQVYTQGNAGFLRNESFVFKAADAIRTSTAPQKVIIGLESSFISSQSSPGCQSAVRVDGIRLVPIATPDPLHLYIDSVVKAGLNTWEWGINGGVRPYTVSSTGSGALNPDGSFHVPSIAGNYVLSASDSAGTTTTQAYSSVYFEIQITMSGMPGGYAYAGTCQAVNLMNMDSTTPHAFEPDNTFGMNPPFFDNAACGVPTSFPITLAGNTSTTKYVRVPSTKGSSFIIKMKSADIASQKMWLKVIGAPTQFGFEIPNLPTIGTPCVPLNLVLLDVDGDPSVAPTAFNVMLYNTDPSPSPWQGHFFYSSADCLTNNVPQDSYNIAFANGAHRNGDNLYFRGINFSGGNFANIYTDSNQSPSLGIPSAAHTIGW